MRAKRLCRGRSARRAESISARPLYNMSISWFGDSRTRVITCSRSLFLLVNLLGLSIYDRRDNVTRRRRQFRIFRKIILVDKPASRRRVGFTHTENRSCLGAIHRKVPTGADIPMYRSCIGQAARADGSASASAFSAQHIGARRGFGVPSPRLQQLVLRYRPTPPLAAASRHRRCTVRCVCNVSLYALRPHREFPGADLGEDPPAAKPKSPAVTRKKSPARKSPARKKSPARTTTASQARKLSVRAARQAKVTLSRLDDPTDTSSDTDVTERSKSVLDDDYAPLQTRFKDNARATRRSIRIAASASKAETEKKLYQLRGADRAASLPAERKNQYKVSPDGKSRGMSAQRDEDLLKIIAYDSETDVDVESDGSKSKKAKADLSKPQEWGGWLGALFLSFALPLGSILLQMACGNEQCSQKLLRAPRLRDLKQWKNFISLEASLAYAGFIAFVSIMSILPIGSIVDGQQSRSGKLQYRVNVVHPSSRAFWNDDDDDDEAFHCHEDNLRNLLYNQTKIGLSNKYIRCRDEGTRLCRDENPCTLTSASLTRTIE
ncbi:unnamed protein product [Trichogramma brassicae]|uniref:Uncharacterized protein n=1 Tax=Trichogramma brassicae TaxID=86971 RepID=A0A6H5J6U9_9HYME|nr:unnamed protein product [Trichogramma brassicae]